MLWKEKKGEEWKEIDQQNNNYLNGPNNQFNFSLPQITKPYQYIYIRINCKETHNINYEFALSKLELYGIIKEDKS